MKAQVEKIASDAIQRFSFCVRMWMYIGASMENNATTRCLLR